MSELNKVKLTDNAEYDLKDDTGTLSSHLHHDKDLVPLESKTYTNVVATANNFDGGWFFYGKLLPTDFYAIYKIHYKITSIAAGRNDTKTVCDVWICGTQSSLLAYASFNRICNTSYLAQHHNELYRATSAGITGGYGHLIGVRLQSAWNPTTAANSRTITIDILEVENCTFTFFENMTLYANVPGTGSTNYSAYTELNGTSNGLQETGDSDTVDNLMAYFNLKTGAQGIWNGSLVMQDGNGTYQNICTASNGTATNANRTTANTKLANANGFRVGSPVYYSSGNYNANSNISSWGSIRSMQGQLFDARYSFNVTLTANSLTPYAPIYLVGTINSSDGLFYLDQTWWTQTPNATDKVYVLVGGCYDSTTSNCRMTLLEHNTWYKYDGSKLVELTNGHIVNKDVPANAVFTDHIYESKQEAQGGTDLSLVTTGEKYAWNHTAVVNDGTLTIKQNGTSQGTFTANQSGNTTVELTDTTYESLPEASGGTDLSLVKTGDKWNWNRTLPFKPGLEVTSLNDLVGLMNNSTDKRCYSGIIKITTDIGVGVTGWQRILAISQNAVNNGTYDVGMYCMFFPNDINIPIKYAIINGISDNNYTVTDTGSLTDNKVLQSPTTSSANYEVLISNSNNDNEETKGVKKTARMLHNPSNGTTTNIGQFRVDQQNGTKTATADSYLFVGNATAAGTAGNSRGVIRIYDTNDKYVHLVAGNGTLTANRTATLPNKTGTLAMTSDIVDTKVTQTWVAGGTGLSSLYPILLSENGNTSTKTGTSVITEATINPYGRYMKLFYAWIYSIKNQDLTIQASNEADYGIFLGVKDSAWCFGPAVTKKLRLGAPNLLWTTVYAQTGSINTSDRNEKKDIVPLDESAKEFIMALNPVSYKFKDGESGRTHYGMIAQDVEEEMTELGMTPMDFAGFCKDQKKVPFKDEEGSSKLMPVEGQYTYGLRYEEFVAPMIKTIQMQQQEIDELKSELAEIKALLLNK